jgi:molybdopterin converting factor small subunit
VRFNMVVSVNFCGLQRKVTQTDNIRISLKEGRRVTDVLSHIRKCYPDLPLSEDAVLVTVNNQISTMDQMLKAHDRISLIPHIGGG